MVPLVPSYEKDTFSIICITAMLPGAMLEEFVVASKAYMA